MDEDEDVDESDDPATTTVGLFDPCAGFGTDTLVTEVAVVLAIGKGLNSSFQ